MLTNDQYVTRTERKRKPWEVIFTEEFEKDLIRKGKKVASQIRTANVPSFEFDNSTIVLIEEIYDEVGFEFLFFGLDDFKSQWIDMEIKNEPPDFASQIDQDYWDRVITEYMQQFGTAAAISIDKFTKEWFETHLAEIIQQGFADGLGIDQIVRNMRAGLTGPEMEAFAKWRAKRIAVTEVIGASNWGAHQTNAFLPDGAKKQWLHSRTTRQDRDEHRAEEARTREGIPIRERYSGAVANQMYPHEPGAPAGQVVNCFPGNQKTSIKPNSIRKVFRSFYSGQVYTIKADIGQITGTPNHPVLTSRGWVALKEIKQGDKLMKSVSIESIGAMKINDTKAHIGDVFNLRE